MQWPPTFWKNIRASDEILYAYVIDLLCQSIQPFPDVILHFIPSLLGTSKNHVAA
jgi:hypothetical protein